MQLIESEEQLITNIETVECYLTEGSEDEKREVVNLIKRGTCFIAYKISNEIRFAPSRFIGYQNNNLKLHKSFATKDGRITNDAINKILNSQPIQIKDIEEKYVQYCESLGIIANEKGAFGAPRKYWLIEIKVDFVRNLQMTDEFPEGKLVERTHLARERNSKVINLAKQNFINKNGRLYCQVCGFDFEKVYGLLGFGYIEGHHTIAVADMGPDHLTKVEDISLVCSNCHRMIHKQRPWLSMSNLSNLIIKK
jgi:hypothetical protein